jgi:uncharacterized protein involved in exopolysaccharide biosynthesis
MNKLYVLAPVILLLVFGFFYRDFIKEEGVRLIEKKAKSDSDAAAETARQKAIEDRARADADERVKKREEEAAKKEADRRGKWDDQGREIAESTAKYSGEADRFTKRSAELEKQLADLRRQKDQATREQFDLQKAVELARIAKRNAELEIQRMTTMITNRATESAMARPPAPPAPPPAR